MKNLNEKFINFFKKYAIPPESKFLVGVSGGVDSMALLHLIKDFIDNTSKAFFQAIMEHLEENRKAFQLAPQKVVSTEEEVKDGAPAEYTVPVAFDSANFFG